MLAIFLKSLHNLLNTIDTLIYRHNLVDSLYLVP